jgi:hypothetical protein
MKAFQRVEAYGRFVFFTPLFSARSSLVAKALGYKPEGRGFETR